LLQPHAFSRWLQQPKQRSIKHPHAPSSEPPTPQMGTRPKEKISVNQSADAVAPNNTRGHPDASRQTEARTGVLDRVRRLRQQR